MIRKAIVASALTLTALSAFIGGYNAETTGMWMGDYGIELNGPEGVELVHCVTDAGLFNGVDC